MKFKPFKRARRKLGVLLPELDRRWRRTRDVAVISYPKSGRTWVRFMLNTANIKLLYDHAGAENRKALTFDQLRANPRTGHNGRSSSSSVIRETLWFRAISKPRSA